MVKIPSNQVFVQGQGSTSADNLNSFVQVCDTAAHLANFPGLPNMLVILLGINTLNDGGQGVFFFANGTGFVSDGYNVFAPTGVTTGAWVRLAAIASSLASLAVPITFSINGTEVGRFDTTGHFLVNAATISPWNGRITLTFPGATENGLVVQDSNTGAQIDDAIIFSRGAGNIAIGSVSTTATTTAFNTSSDKNLKTLDESRTLNSGDVIDGVSPHEFTWNATDEPDFGFFAQELHAAAGDAIPNAVLVGSPDEDFGKEEYRNWGVDLSKLVPVLWAEIQSLRKRVAQLEGAP